MGVKITSTARLMKRSVCGVGYLGIGIHLATELNDKGKPYKSELYRVWESMIRRCYGKKALEHNPTYLDKSVSEEWQCFQTFANWCVKANGFGKKGWELDKDIVIKNNKKYSEGTTFFVPKVINNLFLKAGNVRGLLPIGVTYRNDNKTFVAQCCVGGKRARCAFLSVEQAFSWYKTTKEGEIKRVALLHREDLDPEVLQALLDYKVEITD